MDRNSFIKQYCERSGKIKHEERTGVYKDRDRSLGE